MPINFFVKASQYFDSVSLMQVSRDLQSLPGIEDAALVMGTEANKKLLSHIGNLSPEAQSATVNDLVVMIKGQQSDLNNAVARIDDLLARRTSSPETESSTHRPRTLRSAVRSAANANLAVISLAGTYAVPEAWAALHHKLNVFLFSDNVAVEDEIALKQYAVEHGLLLMGPGAGTAIINGLAVGFANVVPRGPVGIVSAAGTGLQEVSTLLAKQQVGISQAIGVGGRDLSDEVGGLMMMHGLEALQADPETYVIVAISKLPSPAVADKILARLAASEKPAVLIFMGADSAVEVPQSHIFMASTLQEAAGFTAALTLGDDVETVKVQLAEQNRHLKQQAVALSQGIKPSQQYLRGLFSGGTLCQEAMSLWQDDIAQVWSNSPLKSGHRLSDSSQSQGHCALDLGEEEFTVGRPHPMIDNDLRIRRLLQEAHDPEVAVIQMDVVLGYGAHPDPAMELAPTIYQARELASEGRDLIVVTALTGTHEDPQSIANQKDVLQAVGALVMDSNAEASQLASFVVQHLTVA